MVMRNKIKSNLRGTNVKTNIQKRIGALSLAMAMVGTTVLQGLPNQLEKVEAADSTSLPTKLDVGSNTLNGESPQGTTINLFDYWIVEQTTQDNTNPSNFLNLGINANHQLKFGSGMGSGNDNLNHWTGNESPQTGMVYPTLIDGYPKLKKGSLGIEEDESLSYLFNSTTQDGKQAYIDVDKLLQIDEEGYYFYNSQQNFASFNESSNEFTLYDTWAVKAGGSSPAGQFFPFNTADQVFEEVDGQLSQKDINSKNEALNHYFGISMTTRFMQVNEGHTSPDKTKPVTYEFSGDDDVWIFIDDVLVADLGGIHDKSSVSIDFSTGTIMINDGKTDVGGYTTTLKESFEKAGVKWNYEERNTFADETLHTLRFFYLERGNVDSNMSLKFNLVTIPESEIIKVDQLGNPLEGIEFELYGTDENYNIINDTPLATGVTDASGMITLKNADEAILSFDELANGNTSNQQKFTHFILKEITKQDGYRLVGDMKLSYYKPEKTSEKSRGGVILADNPWETGAYAIPKFLVTMPNEIKGIDGTSIYKNDGNNKLQGTVFAVVFKRNAGGQLQYDQFNPVSGNYMDGWKVINDNSIEGVIEAAKETQYVFKLNATGQYETIIEELPGDIKNYYHMLSTDQQNNTEMAIGYYYTTADNLSGATVGNTRRLQNPTDDPFDGIYSSRLYYPNKKNYLFVQKFDDAQTPNTLVDVEFSLYKEEDVENNNGVLTIKDTASPVDTATTDNTTGVLNAEGVAIFPSGNNLLSEGVYYLAETKGLDNYKKNEQLVKVIVDSTGVYADAGTKDDGVKVARGVGSVVETMAYFAMDDQLDTTLHDIKATLQIGTYDEINQTWNWKEETPTQSMHLQYGVTGTRLEYGPYNAVGGNNKQIVLTTDEGIPSLSITQCYGQNHGDDSLKENLGNTDITNLFTGTAIVQITNERTGNLQISKDVEGKDAPLNEIFTFEITLEKNGTPVSDTFQSQVVKTSDNTELENSVTEVTFDTSGKATITLEDDQTITILGLPADAKYTVEENKANNTNNWITTVEQATTNVASGEIVFEQTKEVNFVNTYTPESITWSPKATKTLTGAIGLTIPKLEENMFEFKLISINSENPMPEGSNTNANGYVEKTVGNTADNDNDHKSEVIFGDISFKQSGIYTYYIDEMVTGKNGYTSDSNFYKVVVNVGAENGKLKITSETYEKIATGNTTGTGVNKDNVEFVNEYHPNDVVIELRAVKHVTNHSSNKQLSLEGYTFKVTSVSGKDEQGNAVEVSKIPMPNNNEANSNQMGEVVFEAIEYDVTHVGHTYEYAIQEVIPADAIENENGTFTKDGITYDYSVITATVTIGQDANGLTRNVSYKNGNVENNTFTNVYQASGTFTPTISKTLLGRNSNTDQFTFTIQEDNNNDETGYIMSTNAECFVDNLTDGIATQKSFDAITFTKAGTYSFTITEKIPQDDTNGITYDSSSWNFTVTVTDEGNGVLHTEGVYTKANETNSTSANFVNQYQATGTAVIEGSKVLEGRNWLGTDTFGFKIEPTEETKEKINSNIIEMPQYTEVVVSGVDGSTTANTFEFQPITFKEEGSYTFTVSEMEAGQGAISGIVYDDTIYTVTVTMTDNGTGTLTPSYTYATDTNPNVTNIVFTNYYGASGTTSIEGEKILLGRDWLDTDSFIFRLESNNDATKKAIEEGKIILSGNESIVTADTPNHTFTFPIQLTGILGNETVEYEFKVSEVAGEIPKIENDTHVAIVTVTAKGNVDGTAQVATTTTIAGSLTFTNEYKPDPVDVIISGTKNLSGRELQAGEFSFIMEKVSANGDTNSNALNTMPISSPNTVVNGADSTFAFSPMKFDKKGVYVYRVKEVLPADENPQKDGVQKDGVTYDATSYLVTVEVTDDNNGTLSSNISYQIEQGTGANGVTFHNAYYTEPVSTQINGTKTVVVEDGNYTLQAGDFYFKITGEDEASNQMITGDNIVTNQADGSFIFNGITFTKAGTYSYTVKELDSKLEGLPTEIISGISYDDEIYTITYVVEDNGKGQLVIVSTEILDREDKPQGAITFENRYNPISVSGTIRGQKILEGRQMNMGEFTFSLTPTNETLEAINRGDIVLKDNKKQLEAVNSSRGYFSFGQNAITFNEIGDYTFVVSEVVGNDGNITYDKQSYTVVAHITDNNGVMQLDWELQNKESSITFVNQYTPTPTTTSVTGTKVLEGRALQANEFEFVIEKDSLNGQKEESALNGMPIPQQTQVSNDENGQFVFAFPEQAFTKAGKYEYRVSEVDNGKTGITYSKEVYVVTVDVVDNNGQLQTTTTLKNTNGDIINHLEFVNIYEPQPTSVTLGAFKLLKNGELKAEQFSFQLKDKTGAVLETVSNQKDGTIVFNAITYDTIGTYQYTISEVQGNESNVMYDKTTYSVVVTVSDGLNGYLKAEVTYPDKTAIFENIYLPPETSTEETTTESSEETSTEETATESSEEISTEETITESSEEISTEETITESSEEISTEETTTESSKETSTEEATTDGSEETTTKGNVVDTQKATDGSKGSSEETTTVGESTHTGDNNNIVLYISLAVLSGLCVIGVVVVKKMKKNK